MRYDVWLGEKALTPGMEDENGEEAAEEEPTAGKHSAAKNRDTECETDNSNRGGQAGDRDQSRDHRGGQTNRDDQKLRVHAEDNETSSAWKVGDGGYDSWDSPLRDESSDDAKVRRLSVYEGQFRDSLQGVVNDGLLRCVFSVI